MKRLIAILAFLGLINMNFVAQQNIDYVATKFHGEFVSNTTLDNGLYNSYDSIGNYLGIIRNFKGSKGYYVNPLIIINSDSAYKIEQIYYQRKYSSKYKINARSRVEMGYISDSCVFTFYSESDTTTFKWGVKSINSCFPSLELKVKNKMVNARNIHHDTLVACQSTIGEIKINTFNMLSADTDFTSVRVSNSKSFVNIWGTKNVTIFEVQYGDENTLILVSLNPIVGEIFICQIKSP